MDKVQTNRSKKQGGQKRGAKSKNKRGLPTKSGSALWFYGFHAVQAALQNPHRKVIRFLATSEGLARLSRNQDLQRKLEQAETVDRTDIEKILSGNLLRVWQQVEDYAEEHAEGYTENQAAAH